MYSDGISNRTLCNYNNVLVNLDRNIHKYEGGLNIIETNAPTRLFTIEKFTVFLYLPSLVTHCIHLSGNIVLPVFKNSLGIRTAMCQRTPLPRRRYLIFNLQGLHSEVQTCGSCKVINPYYKDIPVPPTPILILYRAV